MLTYRYYRDYFRHFILYLCKCWKSIVPIDQKLYITHPRVYNYYRYNKFVSVQDVIVDCMLENSDISKKLLNMIIVVDKRMIDKRSFKLGYKV